MTCLSAIKFNADFSLSVFVGIQGFFQAEHIFKEWEGNISHLLMSPVNII